MRQGPVRPWIDLSRTPPGAAARQQAVSQRRAAPLRTTLARLRGEHTAERAWRIGADGEEQVARALARLTRREPLWTSLHAIPVGARGADIDHLVLGPGGVFTLNTKHHPGAELVVGGETFLVNDRRVPYLRNSRFEAERAARMLSAAVGFALHVTAIVVPVGTRSLRVKSQPRDVFVVADRDLGDWLLGTGAILSPPALAAVWEAARRSTTWAG